ncbi:MULTISPECIES: hypothetical protein [Microbacterium]|nr:MULTISPECIES: hypothetical protein [Microbacterium]
MNSSEVDATGEPASARIRSGQSRPRQNPVLLGALRRMLGA